MAEAMDHLALARKLGAWSAVGSPSHGQVAVCAPVINVTGTGFLCSASSAGLSACPVANQETCRKHWEGFEWARELPERKHPSNAPLNATPFVYATVHTFRCLDWHCLWRHVFIIIAHRGQAGAMPLQLQKGMNNLNRELYLP
jgi:hypothetical protein